jgi:hypothetical protein
VATFFFTASGLVLKFAIMFLHIGLFRSAAASLLTPVFSRLDVYTDLGSLGIPPSGSSFLFRQFTCIHGFRSEARALI